MDISETTEGSKYLKRYLKNKRKQQKPINRKIPKKKARKLRDNQKKSGIYSNQLKTKATRAELILKNIFDSDKMILADFAHEDVRLSTS